MSPRSLGRTLIIANPSARGGRGRTEIRVLCDRLASRPQVTNTFEVKLTGGGGDGALLAERYAASYDTLLAVGGDGLVHEVVNGLMRLDRTTRPTLGVIPVGSGNDYARTLKIRANSPRFALDQLMEAKPHEVEVGKVNGTFFMETLSFGVDAAIALEARELHAEGGGSHSAHYLDVGARLFSRAQEGWGYRARFDGEPEVSGRELIIAVQVGESYGGGFRICPHANPADGKLDVCSSQGNPSVPHALWLFGRARFGAHTNSGAVLLRHVRHLELSFDEEPPAQVDGEPLFGTEFTVDVVPAALTVLAHRSVHW